MRIRGSLLWERVSVKIRLLGSSRALYVEEHVPYLCLDRERSVSCDIRSAVWRMHSDVIQMTKRI